MDMNTKLIATGKTYEVKVTGGKILPVKISFIEGDIAEGTQVGTGNTFRFKLSKVKRDYVPPPDPEEVKKAAIRAKERKLRSLPYVFRSDHPDSSDGGSTASLQLHSITGVTFMYVLCWFHDNHSGWSFIRPEHADEVAKALHNAGVERVIYGGKDTSFVRYGRTPDPNTTLETIGAVIAQHRSALVGVDW